MKRYDYMTCLKKDIRRYMEDNDNGVELTGSVSKDRVRLYGELWSCDDVTGNYFGSYTHSIDRAKDNIEAGNVGLLIEAMDDFGIEAGVMRDKGWESADVLIRCYLLRGALTSVLEELEGKSDD